MVNECDLDVFFSMFVIIDCVNWVWIVIGLGFIIVGNVNNLFCLNIN